MEHYSRDMSLALDVGCGEKGYDENFKCKYIGIDRPTYYDVKLRPDVYGDAIVLPFHDNSFDLVTSFSVLPMIEHIDLVLDEMYRVLKPKGIILVVIMNLRGLALQPQTFFWNRYDSRQLNRKLKEHKFKTVMKNNLKALIWSTWFDKTSVYSYAVATPVK